MRILRTQLRSFGAQEHFREPKQFALGSPELVVGSTELLITPTALVSGSTELLITPTELVSGSTELVSGSTEVAFGRPKRLCT